MSTHVSASTLSDTSTAFIILLFNSEFICFQWWLLSWHLCSSHSDVSVLNLFNSTSASLSAYTQINTSTSFSANTSLKPQTPFLKSCLFTVTSLSMTSLNLWSLVILMMQVCLRWRQNWEMEVNNKYNVYCCFVIIVMPTYCKCPKPWYVLSVSRFWNHFQTELPVRRPDWDQFLQQQTSIQEPDSPQEEPEKLSYCVVSWV